MKRGCTANQDVHAFTEKTSSVSQISPLKLKLEIYGLMHFYNYMSKATSIFRGKTKSEGVGTL